MKLNHRTGVINITNDRYQGCLASFSKQTQKGRYVDEAIFYMYQLWITFLCGNFDLNKLLLADIL